MCVGFKIGMAKTGGVLSRLIAVLVEALLPAKSRAVPGITRFCPSDDKVAGAVQIAIPDTLSSHVNVTVTSVLFQPELLGTGALDTDIAGSVLSILISRVLCCSLLPALSTAQ